MGISEATFYNWKKKFAGLGLTELRRLQQLVQAIDTEKAPDISWPIMPVD